MVQEWVKVWEMADQTVNHLAEADTSPTKMGGVSVGIPQLEHAAPIHAVATEWLGPWG